MKPKSKKYESDLKQMGLNLKEQREAKSISQTDLAKKVGVSKTTICSFEKGKTNISLPLIIDICQALEFNVLYLFKNTDIVKTPAVSKEFEEKYEVLKEEDKETINTLINHFFKKTRMDKNYSYNNYKKL